MMRLNSNPYLFISEGYCHCDDSAEAIQLSSRHVLNLRPNAADRLRDDINFVIGDVVKNVLIERAGNTEYRLTLKVNPTDDAPLLTHRRLMRALPQVGMGQPAYYRYSFDGAWYTYTFKVGD